MLTLVVLLIFAAALMAIAMSVTRNDTKARPILLHRDEQQSLHHHRNCPGPGAE